MGKGIVRSNDDVKVYPFEVAIYANYYNLNHVDSKIRMIKPPDYINIHIFEITIGK